MNPNNQNSEASASGKKSLTQELKEAYEVIDKLQHKLDTVSKELKDFAYIVSHDLKAPLRAISQLAMWISDDYMDALDDDGKDNMKLLLRRVKRLENLIEGVLQYSRAGRLMGDVTDQDLNEILTDVIEALDNPNGHSVEIVGTLPTFKADKKRIQGLFENLVGNAVRFMDKEKGEIKISCQEEGDFWKFGIEDNGPGIEEKDFERIFKIFQTLQPKDEVETTGAGLTVVNKIIQVYGGKIWIESKIGEGTTFFFTIPKSGLPAEE